MASVTFTPSTGGDSSTVTDDASATTGLANGGHRVRFIPALTQVVNTAQMAVDKAAAASSSASAAAVSAASAAMAPATSASSTTSILIGTGSKSLTIETGKNFVIGMNIIIASTATPANTMYGQVTGYTTGSGALVVNVTQVTGSGTIAAWTVSLSGPSLPAVINELKGTDIASAATINLDTASGNFVHVTGATTITAITLASGAERTVVFDGALTLTHNATSLILPGARNILTSAGDSMLVRGDGAGNARVVSYQRASDIPGIVNGLKGAAIASAATVNLDSTTGNFVHLTGSTAITAITIAAGTEREVYVDAAPLLTNGANLALPTGANIQAAAGDVFRVRGDGSGKAVVTSYTKANGQPVASGMVLLAKLSPTASANVDFLTTFSGDYDNYLILIDGIKPATDDSFVMRLANAGTADTGSNYSHNASGSILSSMVSAYTPAASTVVSAYSGYSASVTILNANSSANLKTFIVNSALQDAAAGWRTRSDTGIYVGSALSGVRFYWGGGANFVAGGTIRIYGYANT